jgi:hypothetical protein
MVNFEAMGLICWEVTTEAIESAASVGASASGRGLSSELLSGSAPHD